jgi:hypothetical protein
MKSIDPAPDSQGGLDSLESETAGSEPSANGQAAGPDAIVPPPESATPNRQPPAAPGSKKRPRARVVHGYLVINGRLYLNCEPKPELLANFVAKITTQITRHEGGKETCRREIKAEHSNPKIGSRTILIDADEYHSMGWVSAKLPPQFAHRRGTDQDGPRALCDATHQYGGGNRVRCRVYLARMGTLQ